MSRLIIKNLPNGITEEKLRTIFSAKGLLTDLQLKYTKDGKFRNFGFVGYQNEEQASEALSYFNNTCINTNKINVEICSSLGGEDKQRSWSKYAKDSTAFKKIHGIEEEKPKIKIKEKIESTVENVIKEHKNDPLFLEFMEVHSKGKNIWHNDILMPAKSEKNIEIHNLEEPKEDTIVFGKETKKPEINYFTVKIINTPYRAKRTDVVQFFHPLKPSSIRIPKNSRGFCFVGFKTLKDMRKALVKDKSFFKKNQVRVVEFTEKNLNDGNKYEEKKNINFKWVSQEESLKNAEDISESGKIYVRNLFNTVNEDDLQKLFEQFGPIAEINLPIDFETKKIKGFGVVTFVIPEHAVSAFNKLSGSIFQGRMLHLLPYKGRDNETIENNMNDLTFKQKKLLTEKKNAGNSMNWNSLFLGANAVANALSLNYGATKGEILDIAGGGSNAAVRLALGETEIVMNMKKYLEDNGVCLDVFNKVSTAFSKLVIIVKNLPIETTNDEIYKLFSPFGLIAQIILPPYGVTAIVEFTEASEARSAFKNLAYSKFKHLPLYLEWAPENTLKPLENKNKNENYKDSNEKVMPEIEVPKKENIEKIVEKINNDLDDSDALPEKGTTIFIGNLNYLTDEETIKEHFKHIGTIHNVEISKKKNPDNPNEKISLGYGFLQFKKQKFAQKALKEMQFTVIEGNKVELKHSDKILKNPVVKSEKINENISIPIVENKNMDGDMDEDIYEPAEEGTTIFLHNLNFTTRENTIREHFQHIGKIHVIEIANKKDSNNVTGTKSLGYGFIQFKKKQIAVKALKEMQFTFIDGNKVELKRSDRILKSPMVRPKRKEENTPQTGTKIMVKNIPFQAKQNEIRDIFKAFGGLKTVRLPMKIGEDSKHRGFGFVEFVTKSDAKKAFDAVGQSTHLYGRRLVLMWAMIDETVDQLRKRTADHFQSSRDKGSKKGLFDSAGISSNVDEDDEKE